MDSSERGINPVAMTIINPQKEYWPSRGLNQRPPVLKSAMLPTAMGLHTRSERLIHAYLTFNPLHTPNFSPNFLWYDIGFKYYAGIPKHAE